MDKIKITNHQFFSLTFNGTIGGSVMVVSSVIVSIAKQDAWLTALFTPVFGIPLIWVYWFLGSKYPNMTLVEIIREILGKRAGSIVAASFIFLCLTVAYHIPWYVGNFITTQVMVETPTYAINLLFVIAIVLAVLYGIETIARASELFLYFVSSLFFLTIILSLPNVKIENLQPIFEEGIIPILKSSVVLSGFSTLPLIILLMIYPINIDNIVEAKKSIFKGYLLASFFIFVVIIMSILILGITITAKTQYPTYLFAKEVNVGIVFSRVEFVMTAIWIFTEVMIGILFLYAGVKGVSQLLGLKDYKRIVMPLGISILVLSGIVFPNTVYQANWSTVVWIPYIITHGLIIPLILLFVYFIKNRKINIINKK